MHTVNLVAFAGVGFLAIGAIFSVSDLTLSRTSFELMAGPVFWIVGCALMVAWAIGRVGVAVKDNAKQSNQRPSDLKSETLVERAGPAISKAAAPSSHRRTLDGQVIADFLAPLAIWLMLLSFIAVIVLLLGYGSA